MCKAVRKEKSIQIYMEDLPIHTCAQTVHWEYSTSCIYAVESKKFTTRDKHIGIPVYFLQENVENGISVPKYDNYSVMPSDMCTKPCSGPIISRSNKWMTGFRLYSNSDT